MTTIIIKNSKKISRTVFEDWADLQNYLTSINESERSFSKDFKSELNNREKSLLSGEIKGIDWEELKEEFLA